VGSIVSRLALRYFRAQLYRTSQISHVPTSTFTRSLTYLHFAGSLSALRQLGSYPSARLLATRFDIIYSSSPHRSDHVKHDGSGFQRRCPIVLVQYKCDDLVSVVEEQFRTGPYHHHRYPAPSLVHTSKLSGRSTEMNEDSDGSHTTDSTMSLPSPLNA